MTPCLLTRQWGSRSQASSPLSTSVCPLCSALSLPNSPGPSSASTEEEQSVMAFSSSAYRQRRSNGGVGREAGASGPSALLL